MRLSLIIEGRPDQIPEFPQIKNLRVLGQSQANNYQVLMAWSKVILLLFIPLLLIKKELYTIPPFKSEDIRKGASV